MKKIIIGPEILGSDPRLVGISEKYEYQDGKRGNRIGTTLEVLLIHAGFDKIRVSTPELSLPITQEDIDARNSRLDPLKVQLEGFTASPYVDKSGNIAYSAKAEKVILPGIKKEGM